MSRTLGAGKRMEASKLPQLRLLKASRTLQGAFSGTDDSSRTAEQ